jgi:hypothetical protein
MVMSKSKVKGKPKGGAMITTNWMDVVKNSEMKVEDICVFWFVVNRDGRRLTLLVDYVLYQQVRRALLSRSMSKQVLLVVLFYLNYELI